MSGPRGEKPGCRCGEHIDLSPPAGNPGLREPVLALLLREKVGDGRRVHEVDGLGLFLHDCAVETVLGQAAFRFRDESRDVAELVLVGLLTGAWQELEGRVARGLGLEAERAGQVPIGELERALAEFRYERGLIAATEMQRWLAEHRFGVADLEGVLRREWLEARSAGVVCSPGPADRVAAVIRAEAICGGTLARCAGELRAWHAGLDAMVEMGSGESWEWLPSAHASEVAELVSVALADIPSRLSTLGAVELGRRAARLLPLKAGYERFCATAVSEQSVVARIDDRRLEWTVVKGRELSFALEGAALETRLRVVHDGDTLAGVAEEVGVELVRRELEVGSAPKELGGVLLAARSGDLVGPWLEGEHWRVLELDTRLAPEASVDDRAWTRARGELLVELIERFAAGRGGVLAAL